MKLEELVVGAPYIVAGRGEMLLESVERNDQSNPVCRMLEHGRGYFWTLPSALVRQATAEDIQARAEQARARNVDCNSPHCWCVKYRPAAKTAFIEGRQCGKNMTMLKKYTEGGK